MENFENMDWEALPSPAASEAEMKRIRKSIRKQNWKTVFTSLFSMAVMLLLSVQYGVPALESRYWDPNKYTYADYSTDLCFTLKAYTELFCPEIQTADVTSTDTGFASHDVSLTYRDPLRLELHYLTGTLNRNELSIPELEHSFVTGGTFRIGQGTSKERSAFKKNLKSLPSYVKVYAAIGFEKDISLQDLAEIAIYQTGPGFRLDWAAVRVSDQEHPYPDCGFRPEEYTVWYDHSETINDHYDKLVLAFADNSEKSYKAHFNSLLQYSLDQQNNGTGIIPNIENGESFYTDALAYVEENGYNVYGCYVVASPEKILALMEQGNINSVLVLDAWIDL